MLTVLILFLLLAILFDFLNGFHDSSNIVSTMISSRALSPRTALTITAIAEFIGPFLFGVAVATTIGDEVLASAVLTLPVIICALISAVLWNLLTWYFGIPSSSSHALIGGMLGSALMQGIVTHPFAGFPTMADAAQIVSVIKAEGILKILIALLISPLLGFVTGYLLHRLIRVLAAKAHPKINTFFKRAQVVTSIGLALSHGTNDAQKTMGIITMGLLAMTHIHGAAMPGWAHLTEFAVPTWVIALSASAIAAGTATGGWRLIRTLGGKFYKIRPVHGFTTQVSSAAVILGAALLGGPVSTTQVVSSSIMGAGSAERLSKVRWGVGMNIVLTWIITIPSTALVAAILFLVARSVL